MPPAREKPTPAPAPAADRISEAFLMQTLAAVRPADSIVIEEAPGSRPIMQTYLPFDRTESFYTCSSGGLGHGLPAAVGVALAKRAQRVIALIGDGSSMYCNQALWSAADLELPVVFVIVNNGRYAALDHFAGVFGIERAIGTRLAGIDFVSLARGMGVSARRVECANELAPTLREALASPRPVLIDVVLA